MKLLSRFLCFVILSGNLLFAQKTVVTGRVLGCDNMPMTKAFAGYFDEDKNSYEPINVSDDGSFKFETNKLIVRFRFSGVDHRTVYLPLYIEKSAELKFDVLLPAYNYKNNFDDVRIYGNFNNWSINNPPKYNKAENGIYSWDIQSDTDTIKYLLWNIFDKDDQHEMNGTMTDHFLYNSKQGVLVSTIYRRGKTTHIEFDPRKLTRGNTETVINSDMPERPEIKILKEEINKQNYYSEMRERALKDSTFLPDLHELAIKVKSDLEKEKNSFVRGYHCYKYLSLLRDMHVLTIMSEKAVKKLDSSLLVNALNEIDPSSPFWSYNFNLIYAVGSPYAFISQREKYDDYIKKVISLHKDPEVIAEALWAKAEGIKNDIKQKRQLLENPRIDRKEAIAMATKIIKEYKEKNNLSDEEMNSRKEEVSRLIGAEYKRMAEKKKKEINMNSPEIKTANEDLSKQENLSRQCLERIVKEFPNTFRGKMLKIEFFMLKRDDQIPAFEINVMDSNNVHISNNSLKGKYYLLDFWASWCGPCMANMKDLHDVYKMLKDKNFEILSISFDQSDDAVNKFRKEKYPMPWLHTRLEKGFEDEMARRFGVTGIPKMFLISPEGKILANNWDLHGQYFVEKIAKLVNGEKP